MTELIFLKKKKKKKEPKVILRVRAISVPFADVQMRREHLQQSRC